MNCNPCDLGHARGVRSALVNKLYCTDVYCEWVSCLHHPSIFWNSFQETEITIISQMMWNSVSYKSFAIVKLSTAKLNMSMLPAGFPWLSAVPPSKFTIDTVIDVFSSFELLILSLTLLMFWTYRSQRLLPFRKVSILHFQALFL